MLHCESAKNNAANGQRPVSGEVLQPYSGIGVGVV